MRRVAPEVLRQVFNEGRYYERVCSNELLATVETSHPAPPAAGQPPGTVSEMVAYHDNGFRRLALVHQYRRPDGSLGGSGRPDPKRLLLDNEILYC